MATARLALAARGLALSVTLVTIPVLWTYRSTFVGKWEWHTAHDDGINFLQNKHLAQGLSKESLSWMWSDGVLLGVYEPISWLIKAGIVTLHGLTTAAFLRSGLLLHAMTTVMVFLITRFLLFLSSPLLPSTTTTNQLLEASVFGALAFGLHPLRVECLHWISAQPYVYCGFFTALCFLFHFLAHYPTRHRGELRTRLLSQGMAGLLSHVFCVLAILSKSASICLPGVLILLRAYVYPSKPDSTTSLNTTTTTTKADPPSHREPPQQPPKPQGSVWSHLLRYRGLAVILLSLWAINRSAQPIFWVPATGAFAIKLSAFITATTSTAFLRHQSSPQPKLSPALSHVRAHAVTLFESLTWHDLPMAACLFSLQKSMEATHREDHSYRAPTPFIPFESLTNTQRLVKAGYSLTWYLSKTLVPQGIRWNYLLTSPYKATDPVLLLAFLAVILLSLALLSAVVLLRPPPQHQATTTTAVDRKALFLRLLMVSWFAYILLLLPTLGLVNHSPAYWAGDRYSYLPAIILAPWLAGLYLKAQTAAGSRSGKRLVKMMAVMWLAALSTQSRDIASRWRTREAFWQHATQTHTNAIPYYNLGLLYQEKGNDTAAIAAFNKAIELFPIHAPSYCALGLMREKAKDWAGAELLYQKALEAHPQNVPGNLHMGHLAERKGQMTEAIQYYLEALKARPDNTFALFHIAQVYERRRQPADVHDAETYYRAALISSPLNAEVAFRWANLLMKWDRSLPRAKKLLQRALHLRPNLGPARQALSIVEAQIDALEYPPNMKEADHMLDDIIGFFSI